MTGGIGFLKTLATLFAIILPLLFLYIFPIFIDQGKYFLIGVDLALWLLLLIRAFIPGSTFYFRNIIWVFIFYLMTIAFFIELGPSYARPVWIVLCAVMTAIFYGARGALISSLLNCIVLLALFFFVSEARPEWAHAHSDGVKNWLIFTLNLGLLSLCASVAVGFLIDRLDRSLQLERRTREDMQESENKYRLIAENTADTISIMDLSLRFTYISPAMMRLRGFTAEEAMAQTLEETLTPESMQIALAVFAEELALEASGTADPNRMRIMELEEYKKDGSIILVEVSFCCFTRDKEGKAQDILIVSRDITERKQVEEKFRLITDNMLDCIALVDTNDTYQYISPSFTETLGYDPEDLIGIATAGSITHPDDLEWIRRRIREGVEQGLRQVSVETKIRHKDGHYIPAEVRLREVKDPRGKVIGGIHTVRDITQRLQLEQERRQTEDKFRLITENMLDCVALVDMKGVYQYVSPSFRETLGYDQEDLMGNISGPGILHPDDLERMTKLIREGLKQGWREVSIETKILHKDGHYVPMELRVGEVRDQQGKLTGSIHNARDITKRLQLEQERRQTEDKFRLITENMSDCVALVDTNGAYQYVSPSYKDVLGYEAEDMVGITGFDITHPDDLERLTRLYLEGFEQGWREFNFETNIRHKDGHYVPMEVRVRELKDPQEKLLGGILTARDITQRLQLEQERKEAENEKRVLEERLQRSEKMEALGQLAGGVAHDLNNILGVLSGYSELLLLEIPQGQRARSHVEKILQSTQKGAAIIQDLLTLARRGVTTADVINLNSVVSAFLKTPVLESIKDYHPRIIFRTECDESLLNIKGSPVHLEKTLMNLVSNAAESISGSGEVTIRTENRYLDKPLRGYDEVKEGDYAVLTVSDTGMGIPVENREKIFEPFFTKKKMGRSGTGLGLAIVWGTVKDHHGYIDVQTEVGKGAIFTLYFPVTREELVASQVNEPIERYMGKGESILVVDDVAEQRDVASGLLTRLGYKVHAVTSGEEAVEYLKGNKADLLVLDMIMSPGIDGLETYEQVLKINPQQKAILVSGFSETDRVRETQNLGAGTYVKKPYLMENIGMAIRDELNR